MVDGTVREVVEQLESSNGKRRAIILRRPDGAFQVDLERHVPGDEFEPAYWSPLRGPVVIADTLERARELAREGVNAL